MTRTVSLRVHQFRGDAAAVAEHADSAVAVCEAHEFVHYLAMSLILRGWALASQGEFERGIVEMQDGLEKQRAAGALVYETYALGLLADACITNGRYGQAFDFLSQAELRLEAETRLRPILRERDIPVVRRGPSAIGQGRGSGRAIFPEGPCGRARARVPSRSN